MGKTKEDNRYFGFDDLLTRYYKVKPKSKSKQNEELKAKFEKRHVCHTCKSPLVYVGGNVMTCKNPECASPNFELLDAQGKAIANSLYGG